MFTAEVCHSIPQAQTVKEMDTATPLISTEKIEAH